MDTVDIEAHWRQRPTVDPRHRRRIQDVQQDDQTLSQLGCRLTITDRSGQCADVSGAVLTGRASSVGIFVGARGRSCYGSGRNCGGFGSREASSPAADLSAAASHAA